MGKGLSMESWEETGSEGAQGETAQENRKGLPEEGSAMETKATEISNKTGAIASNAAMRPQKLRTKTFPLASRQEGWVTCLRTLFWRGGN